jgi:hypothetical protein
MLDPRLLRERSRQHRRTTLEIRTLTVSLRAALADLDSDTTLTPAERVAIRRAWCDRVAVLLQDIRVRSMRIATLTARAGAQEEAVSTAAMVDTALANVVGLAGPISTRGRIIPLRRGSRSSWPRSGEF